MNACLGTPMQMDTIELTDNLISFCLEAHGMELTVIVLRDVSMWEMAKQLEMVIIRV